LDISDVSLNHKELYIYKNCIYTRIAKYYIKLIIENMIFADFAREIYILQCGWQMFNISTQKPSCYFCVLSSTSVFSLKCYPTKIVSTSTKK